MIKCDLHVHSTASDGRYSPSQIVQMAYDNDVNFLSLTDHDTLSGIDEAFEKANSLGLNFIPGIELSTEHKKESIHVLGFFKKDDYKNKELNDLLSKFKKERIDRAYKIVENLKKYNDIEIDINNVLKNGKDTIARPHIAKAIMDAGYNFTNEEIFDKVLGNHCPAYIPSTKLSTKEGIALLKKYNALVFLAHPVLARKTPVYDLIKLGFDGMEAIYYQNSKKDTKRLITLAKETNIYISAGSDCHGIPNDENHGGVGDIAIPTGYDIDYNLSWIKKMV
ncbi:PHP domain-containing protein [Clostridium sp.]|uniref:PHP domain-containing protein n=1 Tax=Clostridium sp. TaxID=1506 RepID=UPI003F3767C8